MNYVTCATCPNHSKYAKNVYNIFNRLQNSLSITNLNKNSTLKGGMAKKLLFTW